MIGSDTWLFLSLFLHLQFIHCAPLADASSACSELDASSVPTACRSLGILNPDYSYAKTHYWSAANADLSPACVVFPTSAQEVSYVVGVLQRYPAVKFAVKSGGHNPNVGFSSVDNGVLISFSNLSTTTISSDKALAYVQPGARWEQVMAALNPYGVAVPGGRLGMSNMPYSTYITKTLQVTLE
jgi:hypothetical protein